MKQSRSRSRATPSMSPAQFVGSLLGCWELDTVRALSKLRSVLAASGYIWVRGGRVKVCPLYAQGQQLDAAGAVHPTGRRCRTP
ncbi:Tetrathionate reductase subunit C [Stenotrophomonas maltophilia]|nr:Tetrathionate reductase subunit C [Stenotrophomonas maltophilia]